MLSDVGQMGRRLLLPSTSGDPLLKGIITCLTSRAVIGSLQHSILIDERACCRNRTCQRHPQRAQAMLCQLRGRMSLACQQSHRERSSSSSQADPICITGPLLCWCSLCLCECVCVPWLHDGFHLRPACMLMHDCKWPRCISWG